MKKILISLTAILLSLHCMAQEQLAFPFQGGKDVMTSFFKDSLAVSPDIIQKRATGVVIFKFTADEKGNITKLVVYYADDAILIPPVIDAIKKSNHKWVIPDHEKFHDFILQFVVSFNPPESPVKGLQKAVYDYNRHRKPMVTTNQVPLNEATLLPTVMVNYDITE